MYKESFPSKLKQARQDAGYTQAEIANRIHLKQYQLSSYETGKTEPDIETLGLLADFYGVSVDWLLGTKGGKNK